MVSSSTSSFSSIVSIVISSILGLGHVLVGELDLVREGLLQHVVVVKRGL